MEMILFTTGFAVTLATVLIVEATDKLPITKYEAQSIYCRHNKAFQFVRLRHDSGIDVRRKAKGLRMISQPHISLFYFNFCSVKYQITAAAEGTCHTLVKLA